MLDGIKLLKKHNKVEKVMHDTLDNCKVLVKMADGTQKVIGGKEWLDMECALMKDFTFL